MTTMIVVIMIMIVVIMIMIVVITISHLHPFAPARRRGCQTARRGSSTCS